MQVHIAWSQKFCKSEIWLDTGSKNQKSRPCIPLDCTWPTLRGAKHFNGTSSFLYAWFVYIVHTLFLLYKRKQFGCFLTSSWPWIILLEKWWICLIFYDHVIVFKNPFTTQLAGNQRWADCHLLRSRSNREFFILSPSPVIVRAG